MITNDNELQATQERIVFFYKTLANMRLKATPEEYRLYSNSYLVEIDGATILLDEEHPGIIHNAQVPIRPRSIRRWVGILHL